MTLHPIPLNFLIYEENFLIFFISVNIPYFFRTVRILTEGRAGEGAHLRSIQASTKKWKSSLKEATPFHPDKEKGS
jgi:hypothetical protein